MGMSNTSAVAQHAPFFVIQMGRAAYGALRLMGQGSSRAHAKAIAQRPSRTLNIPATSMLLPRQKSTHRRWAAGLSIVW